MQEKPLSNNGKIPVTVLTGFLGSGKTTLVNHILTADHGHRIAVIENEFGEIPIDNALVFNGQEQIIEMSNGCCLCCTARTDLIDILHALLQRPERLDRVVIETSGMADPNPVAQTFFVDDVVTANYSLDAIVTLVDAKHVEEHLAEVDHNGVGAHTYDQIAFADKIVINKVDLVGPEDVTRLEQRLRRINATAPITTSSYANIDLPAIVGTGAFDLARTMASNPDWLDENQHLHDPALDSFGIELSGDLDEDAIRAWLSALVQRRGNELYRLKGVVAVRGDNRQFVIQGIHDIVEIQPTAAWGRQPRSTKMVFIGRNLDGASLTTELKSCLA